MSGLRVLLIVVGTGLLLATCSDAPPTPPAREHAAAGAPAPTAAERRGTLNSNIPKHERYLGALAPENLAKERRAPPFDLTGTWFIDFSRAFAFRFGPPYPDFVGRAKQDFEYSQQPPRGASRRDAAGQCYPSGIPMMMMRIRPIALVQLPTVIYMISSFDNEFRQIFLDDRPWADPDTVIYTYNGESHGRWEGDTLVVDTRYVETWNHYIGDVPISEEFRVQERMRLLENGEVLEIEYIMTDPVTWVGEWRSTKRWLRVDYTDIGEDYCLSDVDDNLPSTQAGRVGLKE